MHPRTRRRLSHPTTLALLVVLAVGGCGPRDDHPETVPVQGKVTYGGKPVPKGTITFESDSGQPAVGEIQPDGTYRLGTFAKDDGAVPGHHKVTIIANTGDPNIIPGSTPGYVPPKDIVPKKYGQAATSGLEVNVSKEKTTYDFDLK